MITLFYSSFSLVRRAFFQAGLLFSLFLFSHQADAQQIGVNYNGMLNTVDSNDLQRTQTTWVRGFVDFFVFYNNPSLLNTDARIQGYLSLKGMGYKTVLNIKWDFADTSFPATNSATMTSYKNFLVELLDKVWDNTDIIVVGNEPFIESKPAERDSQLADFYKAMAQQVKFYRDSHTNIPIYIGSFDNMYTSEKQDNTAVNLLLDYAKNTSWLAGVDMHIHHSELAQIATAMDFVNPRIRSNQKIIITEYSLMKHWRSQLGGTIPSGFASAYGRNASWKNYQYIDYALKNPVSRPEWVAYLSASPWFENRKRYLLNSYNAFASYSKFFLATYAIQQGFPPNATFTADTDPWILNGLYVNRSVVPNPTTGEPQFNYSFIDDFRAIQSGSARKGASEVVLTPETALYPNPATDYLTIRNIPEGEQITILNGQGRILRTETRNPVSIQDLPQGVYWVRLAQSQKVLKLVKQ